MRCVTRMKFAEVAAIRMFVFSTDGRGPVAGFVPLRNELTMGGS